MKTSLVNKLIGLAIDNKENKTIHHQAIMVKNGKIIGIGTNSLDRMNMLGNDNSCGVNIHAEVSAIKNYINNNQKSRKNFKISKSYIRSCFYNSMDDESFILCKKRVQKV